MVRLTGGVCMSVLSISMPGNVIRKDHSFADSLQSTKGPLLCCWIKGQKEWLLKRVTPFQISEIEFIVVYQGCGNSELHT